jgi:sulfate permease, SulP family
MPTWLRHYRREWLGPDIVAGVIVWSVVVPQAVAYAQIAGLPPSAGLVAAPGALLAYALLGTSRVLVVSATTSASALSAAAVAPLADGDPVRYAALSAALALLAAGVLAAAGLLRLGGLFDLISKPVMTGFLFGLGLTIAIGQVPKLLGVAGGSGTFFERLWALLGDLGDTHGATLAVGVASVAVLLSLNRLAPAFPATLALLALAVAASALLDLSDRGVEVVGDLPSAFPELAFPDVSWNDIVNLLPAAFGVMLVATEGIGVARSLAASGGYSVDTNRDLVALGGSNAVAGLSQGFVQLGGSSQTAAAVRAGGRTQLASLLAAGLVVLTGAFLAPLFEDLPQATLGAIVVVAVAGFFRVGELRRFASIRASAIAIALVALGGVLVLGILPGLLVAAGLSLIVVIKRLSRPEVGTIVRDPSSGAWGRADRHPDWQADSRNLVTRVDGPLFYANALSVKERLLDLVQGAERRPEALVLELAESADLDVESLDALAELAGELAAEGIELRLAAVRAPAVELLRRSGLADRVRITPTVDAAISPTSGPGPRST